MYIYQMKHKLSFVIVADITVVVYSDDEVIIIRHLRRSDWILSLQSS